MSLPRDLLGVPTMDSSWVDDRWMCVAAQETGISATSLRRFIEAGGDLPLTLKLRVNMTVTNLPIPRTRGARSDGQLETR